MPVKLMVVDDEKIICETIKDYFEDNGWSVRIFNTGDEALCFLENDYSEYVIVDGRLPEMSGTDFIKQALRLKKGMKYIIYTGSYDFKIDDDLRSAGVTEKNIITKPVMEFSTLHNALEQLNTD